MAGGVRGYEYLTKEEEDKIHKQTRARHQESINRYQRDIKQYKKVKEHLDKKMKSGQELSKNERIIYGQLDGNIEYFYQQVNSIYTKIEREAQSEIKKANESRKAFANPIYDTGPGNTQVNKQASITQKPTKSAVNITDDYVQPRENKIKQDIQKATPQQAKQIGLTKEEFKKKMQTSLDVDEFDPSSLSNIAGLKKSPKNNRELETEHQAAMIKKYVPALTKTTAVNNDPPKKASTVNNYASNNAELFMDEVSIIDRDWISSRFLVPSNDLSRLDQINRFFSTTGWKYNSTQLGANIAINARPQFTRYADIRGNNTSLAMKTTKSFTSKAFDTKVTLGRSTNNGIGRYYSESIDDNATLVFLEFGVPKFNNLFTYFIRAVTYEDMYIANHGTTPTGYTLGKAVGALVNLYFFPLTTIIIYAYKAVFGFFFGGPLDYYYFSSAMPQYWATANNILNKIAVELGLILPAFEGEGSDQSDKIGAQAKLDESDLQVLSEIIPGAFYPSTNYIDLTYIAARLQILSNNQAKAEYQEFVNKDDKVTDFIGYVTDGEKWKKRNAPGESKLAGLDNWFKFTNLTDFFKKHVVVENSEYYPVDPSLPDPVSQTPDPSGSSEGAAVSSSKANSDANNGANQNSVHPDGAIRRTPGFWDSLSGMADKVKKNLEHKAEVLDSTIREGAKYAIFSVDFQGSVSESVSNSASDIELGGMLKGAGAAARNVKFNLSGGNLIPGLAQAGDLLKNFAMGALESMSFGLSNVISTLMGNTFITFPKKWDDSELSFPQVTYNMTLISPYGNTMSQLQNIYIPLAMLLAGSLPLSTGERSYTSPFLCTLFNKGIQNIRLGMITSLSISRGSSNLPFSRWKKPLAVEVSFTVTDFSTLMAAPINSSIFGGEFNMRLNQDNKFDEYIGVLCGRDIYTDIYFVPKLKKKISRMAMAITQTFAGTNSMASAGSSAIFGWMGLFTKDRNIGANQNNQIYY